jgi:hypothetical protein
MAPEEDEKKARTFRDLSPGVQLGLLGGGLLLASAALNFAESCRRCAGLP